MSLLTVCQGAARQLSIAVPGAIIGSQVKDVAVLLELAQGGLIETAKRAAWQILQAEQTFSTVAAETQTNALPADFGGFIDETMWDRTARRRYTGPVTQQEWQRIKSGGNYSVNPIWRQRGNSVLFSPAPGAGNTIAFEYQTTKLAVTSGGTAQTTYTADTDSPRLDEQLMKLDLIWRWRRHKGMDYEQEERDFERYLLDVMIRDGGKKVITLDERSGRSIYPYVPDIMNITSP